MLKTKKRATKEEPGVAVKKTKKTLPKMVELPGGGYMSEKDFIESEKALEEWNQYMKKECTITIRVSKATKLDLEIISKKTGASMTSILLLGLQEFKKKLGY